MSGSSVPYTYTKNVAKHIFSMCIKTLISELNWLQKIFIINLVREYHFFAWYIIGLVLHACWRARVAHILFHYMIFVVVLFFAWLSSIFHIIIDWILRPFHICTNVWGVCVTNMYILYQKYGNSCQNKNVYVDHIVIKINFLNSKSIFSLMEHYQARVKWSMYV